MIGDILQPTHLLFILVIALLVLGPKRLPEVGRSLGRGMRDFRNAISGDDHHEEIAVDTSARTEDPAPEVDRTPELHTAPEPPAAPEPVAEAEPVAEPQTVVTPSGADAPQPAATPAPSGTHEPTAQQPADAEDPAPEPAERLG